MALTIGGGHGKCCAQCVIGWVSEGVIVSCAIRLIKSGQQYHKSSSSGDKKEVFMFYVTICKSGKTTGQCI